MVKSAFKKRFLIFMFATLIFIVLIYLFMFHSNYFEIKTIKVVGNRILSYNDIKELAMIDYGMNIFKVNPKKIESNLLANPYIRESKVKIQYPSTVEIFIKERRIVAQVKYQNDYLMIDKEGVVIKKENYNPELPVIEGIKVEKYQIGKKLSDIFEKSYLGTLLELIEGTDFYTVIKYENEKQIILVTKNGIEISFDNPSDVNYSFKFAEIILKDLAKRGYHKGTIQIIGDSNPVFMP
ncbi:cell division protein FtsQ/DivIB [Thermoanaerobacter uzonensis]|uniref:cell division protein FtsQ/DivIB n=1 Tax=Thermoanaerobacter uzonensis TaxID=447593 RepID=UPI003D7682F6